MCTCKYLDSIPYHFVQLLYRVIPVEMVQYETVTGGTKCKETNRSGDAEYEVMEGVGGTYEEVDKLRQQHPPRGEYELSLNVQLMDQ